MNTISKIAKQLVMKKHKIQLPLTTKDGVDNAIFNILNSALQSMKKENRLLLPNFEKAGSMFVFSDYGGEAKDSNYYTYSFSFVDINFLSLSYHEHIELLRENYGLNSPLKEISFKSLGYAPVGHCLKDFLQIVNNEVNGLVFTLVVDKKITTLFGDNGRSSLRENSSKLLDLGFGEWKGHIVEKLLRILSVLSFFVPLLAQDVDKICWMTDDDSIVANDEKSEKLQIMLGNALNYCKQSRQYDTIGFCKPFETKDTVFYSQDLLSISDLVAGGIEHYFTRKDKMEELTVKEGANEIIKWLAIQGIAFKKMSVMVTLKDNMVHSGPINFSLAEPMENLKYIDIVID